jgi:hypothetical protein
MYHQRHFAESSTSCMACLDIQMFDMFTEAGVSYMDDVFNWPRVMFICSHVSHIHTHTHTHTRAHDTSTNMHTPCSIDNVYGMLTCCTAVFIYTYIHNLLNKQRETLCSCMLRFSLASFTTCLYVYPYSACLVDHVYPYTTYSYVHVFPPHTFWVLGDITHMIYLLYITSISFNKLQYFIQICIILYCFDLSYLII